VHTLLYCSAAAVLGFELVAYSVVLRLLMLSAQLLPADPVFVHRLGAVKLEHGLALSVLLILTGSAGTGYLLNLWREQAFGDLDPFVVMRMAIPSVTAITLGLQVSFAALFLSLVKWQIRSLSAS
jgi:hypothetical protein